MSINCAALVGPPLNFVDRTMKYYLGLSLFTSGYDKLTSYDQLCKIQNV